MNLLQRKMLLLTTISLCIYFNSTTLSQISEKKIYSSDGMKGDWFGASVSIYNDAILVGAYKSKSNGISSGACYIFQKLGEEWIEKTKLFPADKISDQQFGFSVEIKVNIAIVGATGDNEFGHRSGAVYVFNKSGNTWSQTQKLIPNDLAQESNFGFSIACYKDYLLVGAPGPANSSNIPGAVYVYRNDGSSWIQSQKINAPNLIQTRKFGHKIVMENDVAVISAPQSDSERGSVYIYKLNNNIWSFDKNIVANEVTIGDWFGSSIALDKNTLLIGAQMTNNRRGRVYVYSRSDDEWIKTSVLLPNDASDYDRFGYSVSINDNFAIISSAYADDQGNASGKAYVFSNVGIEWIQEEIILASDGHAFDFFGWDISQYNDEFVVGAWQADGVNPDCGAVYSYRIHTLYTNPKVSFYNLYRRTFSNPRFLTSSLPDGAITEPVKICADGRSNITLISFKANQSINLSEISFRILEDSGGNNHDKFGYFSLPKIVGDSVVIYYQHPTYVEEYFLFKPISIQIINIFSGKIIFEYPIRIYRIPVLFLHGLWSDATTFDNMKTAIYNTNLWPLDFLYAYDYSTRNDYSFEENRHITEYGVFNLLDNIIKQKYSAGGVAVVAHSMGGVLSRIYLQSDQYKNDLNRLITLNTPHSGSQMANLISSNISFLVYGLKRLIGRDPSFGAVNDLKVDSEGIREYLNGPSNINHNKASSHCIETNTSLIEASGWVGYILKFIKYRYLLYATDFVIDSIFNFKNHDIVVASESQIGGLFRYTSFTDQWHSSLNNSFVITRVFDLLNANTNDITVFSSQGYDPPILTYNWPVQENLMQASFSDSIKFLYPPNGANFSAGENIVVQIGLSSGINNFIIAYGNPYISINYEEYTSTTQSIPINIPLEAFGELYFALLGFDESGNVYMATLDINITTTALIDSIKITTSSNSVIKNFTNSLNVKGFFSDGIIRTITSMNELVYTSGDASKLIVSHPGIIQGISEGEMNVYATYNSLIDSSLITVLSDVPISSIFNHQNNVSDNEYILYQNYPNPFNPATVIKFSVANREMITLKVYNLIGQEITTLVKSELEPGTYTAAFDASKLSSGVYFYQLTGNSVNITKKMILTK